MVFSNGFASKAFVENHFCVKVVSNTGRLSGDLRCEVEMCLSF